MKRTIRRGVFETNSSSMHSISITEEEEGQDKNIGETHGVVVGYFGEYGWGYERLTTPLEKLSYVLTSLPYLIGDVTELDDYTESVYVRWLGEMVKDYTGSELEIQGGECQYHPMGYIDHESTGILRDYWSEEEEGFKSNMRDLIFSSKYTIVIDNDNNPQGGCS